jgi:Nucleotidyltransferase domain.
MLELTEAQLHTVRTLLAARLPGREVRVFGSRATGQAKPHSDLDLAVMGDAPVDDRVRAELMADFDDSDLPFRVDLLVWCETPAALRQTITRDGLPLITH